ncbi:hypothetical protein HMPREF3190_00979 [Umbribacter vaginalis]|nr:hypothetical protein HMPREF3190_00979 [Coriobacteriales bacterium DNF00809]
MAYIERCICCVCAGMDFSLMVCIEPCRQVCAGTIVHTGIIA